LCTLNFISLAPKLVTKNKRKSKKKTFSRQRCFLLHTPNRILTSWKFSIFTRHISIYYFSNLKTLDANIAHFSQVRSFAMMSLMTVGIKGDCVASRGMRLAISFVKPGQMIKRLNMDKNCTHVPFFCFKEEMYAKTDVSL
jgi:hypothetical protein